jgi:hypothetical protein
MFLFGLQLQKELDVPIGLIVKAYPPLSTTPIPALTISAAAGAEVNSI